MDTPSAIASQKRSLEQAPRRNWDAKSKERGERLCHIPTPLVAVGLPEPPAQAHGFPNSQAPGAQCGKARR